MITSTSNPKIKWVRALQTQGKARRQKNAFVVEGVRLVEEALHAGWQAELILHIPEPNPRMQEILDGFAHLGVPAEPVSQAVMRAASDTATPQGILAVLRKQVHRIPSQASLLLIPDAVRDPGNLGTMLRTAAAAGTDAVLVPPGSADPYAPKVIRAGMGAHFKIPIQRFPWRLIGNAVKGMHVFLADAHRGVPYYQADFQSPAALIIGGEAAGASQSAQALVHDYVQIPMAPGVESLNAAMAAGILLFEIRRQRVSRTSQSMQAS